ncbi:WXG100-like domain-containing protein [Streptomyces broussonetiae]|uniref:WXG100-like domain-containing protein n=1 Tax=Streptomyces broussonetiae TaxID=2686304 RepID=UPI0035D782E4
MTDAHHVPPELQNLLMVVVGKKWPTGDEAALRAEAASWRRVATTLQACTQDVAEVRKHVDTGLEGATREAIDQFLTTLLGGWGDNDSAVLPTIVRCCDDAADALDDLANEIETLRIEITGALIVLATQLMVDATYCSSSGACRLPRPRSPRLGCCA